MQTISVRLPEAGYNLLRNVSRKQRRSLTNQARLFLLKGARQDGFTVDDKDFFPIEEDEGGECNG